MDHSAHVFQWKQQGNYRTLAYYSTSELFDELIQRLHFTNGIEFVPNETMQHLMRLLEVADMDEVAGIQL